MGEIFQLPIIQLPYRAEFNSYDFPFEGHPYNTLTNEMKANVDAIVSGGLRQGIRTDSSFTFTSYLYSLDEPVYCGYYIIEGDPITVNFEYAYRSGNGIRSQLNDIMQEGNRLVVMWRPNQNLSGSSEVNEVLLQYSPYPDRESLLSAISPYRSTAYPITYHYTNSVVSGPSEAEVGDTVTVSAVPDNNYGITDPATQILVTNNDVAVSYQWNPSTNTITFVMPDPT